MACTAAVGCIVVTPGVTCIILWPICELHILYMYILQHSESVCKLHYNYYCLLKERGYYFRQLTLFSGLLARLILLYMFAVGEKIRE